MTVEAERINLEFWAEESIYITVIGAELNRLRFDASIATTLHPGRFDALDEFLAATDDV